MKAIVSGAALLALSVTAGAEDSNRYSANNMLVYCKAFIGEGIQAKNMLAASYCNGMIDMLIYMSPSLIDDPAACIQVPKGATNTQAARIIVRYVEARPGRMHETLHGLAIEALHEAWPCRPSEFDKRFRGNRDSDR
jgi:Rap1a immunity proteins